MQTYEQMSTFTSPAAAGTAAQAAIPICRYSDALVVEAHIGSPTGGTLDIYIQETWDVDSNGVVSGSAVWTDVCHFAQSAAAGAAVVYRFTLQTDETIQTVGTGSTGSPGVALAAGKVCGGPWGPMVRVVAVAGAGTSAGASVSVKFRQRRPGQE